MLTLCLKSYASIIGKLGLLINSPNGLIDPGASLWLANSRLLKQTRLPAAIVLEYIYVYNVNHM